MSFGEPRVVLVTRKTPLEHLLDRWGTRTQATFYLQTRAQRIEEYQEAHERFVRGVDIVVAALPADRRRARVDREQLDRFIFAPDDVVVFIGQDGLVANGAKYLRGQLAIGINPDRARYEGVLVPHDPEAFPALLAYADHGRGAFAVEERTMVEARREDGQVLLALNEVYVGHRTHQSARYRLRYGKASERHSSSGVIVASGTGATGWARSISGRWRDPPRLPAPAERRLVFFVREPWPSVATGNTISAGALAEGTTLELMSDMPDDGVAFGDGMESDAVEFLSGHTLAVSLSDVRLRLVVGAQVARPSPGGGPPRPR